MSRVFNKCNNFCSFNNFKLFIIHIYICATIKTTYTLKIFSSQLHNILKLSNEYLKENLTDNLFKRY